MHKKILKFNSKFIRMKALKNLSNLIDTDFNMANLDSEEE